MARSPLNGIIRIGGFPQGVLSGIVIDQMERNPVAEARVQVLSDWPVVVGQVVSTDSEGRFSLLAAPRRYTVSVTAEGYAMRLFESVTVTTDRETLIEIELKR